MALLTRLGRHCRQARQAGGDSSAAARRCRKGCRTSFEHPQRRLTVAAHTVPMPRGQTGAQAAERGIDKRGTDQNQRFCLVAIWLHISERHARG